MTQVTAKQARSIKHDDLRDFTRDLEKLTRRLRRICRDRIDVPGDVEVVDELYRTLLKGHRLLTAMADRYGEGS